MWFLTELENKLNISEDYLIYYCNKHNIKMGSAYLYPGNKYGGIIISDEDGDNLIKNGVSNV